MLCHQRRLPFFDPVLDQFGLRCQTITFILSISKVGLLCTCGRWSKSSIPKLNSVKFAPTIL